MGTRVNPDIMEDIIYELCSINHYKTSELAKILHRNESYIAEKYIRKMMEEGRLGFTIPEVVNHYLQAYKAIKS